LQIGCPEQLAQSAAVKQCERHMPFTHSWPDEAPQSALLVHCATRPVFGWHRPAMQASPAVVQSVWAVQLAWQ
jgi:hypothetical protein